MPVKLEQSISLVVSFMDPKALICKVTTSYNINDSPIKTSHLHKDLGVMISDDLNWDKHRRI